MSKRPTNPTQPTSTTDVQKTSSKPKDAAQPPRRPRERAARMDPAQRQEQIVQRAIEYFAAEGFSANTRELARKIGVTQSLLFRYFPTKEALVDKVYEHVYLSRLTPDLENMLEDRSLPIDERLKRYYVQFARTVTQRDWVRIFMFAGLREPTINERLLAVVRERIFLPVATELRSVFGLPKPVTGEDVEMDIELVWALHASIFYLGVRKWIYQMPVPKDVDPLIETLVDGFIHTFKSRMSRPVVAIADPKVQISGHE